jgi:hypothetical protein
MRIIKIKNYFFYFFLRIEIYLYDQVFNLFKFVKYFNHILNKILLNKKKNENSINTKVVINRK